MQLIYLHGPPASGKYTIARELEARIGARILHNHLTLDVAKALFEFDTEPFWNLVEELRRACVTAVCKQPDITVVYTACYSHPEDEDTAKFMESTVASAGGRFLPVFLQCDVAELERRVSDPSRIEMRKLSTLVGLRSALEKWNFVGLPTADCVTVVTNGRTPEECAAAIIDRLGR